MRLAAPPRPHAHLCIIEVLEELWSKHPHGVDTPKQHSAAGRFRVNTDVPEKPRRSNIPPQEFSPQRMKETHTRAQAASRAIDGEKNKTFPFGRCLWPTIFLVQRRREVSTTSPSSVVRVVAPINSTSMYSQAYFTRKRETKPLIVSLLTRERKVAPPRPRLIAHLVVDTKFFFKAD